MICSGGAGNDTLGSGGGTDTASYSDAASAVAVDLRRLATQVTLGTGSDRLSLRDHARPSDNERDAHSAFIEITFPRSQRPIVGCTIPAAVVAGEDHECVFREFLLIEFVENLANRAVDGRAIPRALALQQ